MVVMTVILGLTYLILGIKFYNTKMLHLLNGINIEKVDDPIKLGKNVGKSYIILAVLLFLEAIAYSSFWLSQNSFVFCLVATVILGPIIMTIVLSQYI